MQHRPSTCAAPTAPMQAGLGATRHPPAPVALASAHKMDCGWYDSSYDLTRGLDIVEQDDDALYQLWTLARH